MSRLRPALSVLAIALALPLSACEKGQEPIKHAVTEGAYVTAGGLKYQIQVSRKLNPYDTEDSEYLSGVTDAAKQVANPNEVWYGVFIRVENRSNKDGEKGRTILPASNFYIEDTTEDRVDATPLPASNLYGFRAKPIKAGDHLPAAGSTAASAPIGGSLVLFKARQTQLDNRPTKLYIVPPVGKPATIVLDI